MTTVDRLSRDKVAAGIRSFLDEETTAFEFDAAIFEIESDDPTVDEVVQRLWLHYDDLKDHKVALTRSEWHYFQRLLLILESDGHIERLTTIWRWRPSQLVAFVTLIGFVGVVWRFGFGEHILVTGIPFGVVSILITYWRQRTDRVDASFVPLTPFSSIAELRDTYRSVNGFRKHRFPKGLQARRIRSGAMNRILMISTWLAWLMFSPLVLILQMLPVRERKTRVRSGI